MPTPADMRNERMTAVLLAICIVGSVLAIGTVHLPALLVLALLVAVAVVLSRRSRKQGRRSWPGAAVVLALLGAFSLLQALPLPAALVTLLAPNAADIQARALLPLGEAAPGWMSLSLDQGASLVEGLKWWVYAGVFVVADILGERRGTLWTVRVVFVSALLAALATLAHGLAGLTKVYGLFQPSYQPEMWHVGPLLNPNNLAGYLNLGAMCGIGVGLHRDRTLPYHLAWPGVALIIAVGVLSASRGGVLFLVLGLLALAIALMTRKLEGKRSRRPELLAMAAAVVVGVGMALLGGTRDSWSELYDNNVSKLGLASDALPMIRQHPLFGVGRGAFESTFTAYRYGYENRVFAHAENWLTQWVAEWGVPVTVVAALALAWQLRPSQMDLRREVGLAAYIGAIVLLVHNFVDLGLELPGVCVALFSLLGALHGATRRDERKRVSRRRVISSKVAVYGYAAVAGVAAVCALAFGRADVASDRRQLATRYAQADLGDVDQVDAMRASLRVAMWRHPAEPYFPLLGGTLAWRLRDQDPMPWIQRSLERGMGNGRTHFLLAQILAERGLFPQARLELRLAIQNNPELAASAVRTALRSSTSFAELNEAVPSGEQGIQLLDALSAHLRSQPDAGSQALRADCDRAILAIDPNRLTPRMRLAGDVIAALEQHDGERCPQAPACEAEVLAHVKALEASAPRLSHGVQLRAQLLAAGGASEQADALLVERCPKVEDRKACLTERVNLASKASAPLFAAAVKDLLALGCGDYGECAATHSWLAHRYQQRADWPLALKHHVKAARTDPSSERWLAVARAASKANLHGQAVEALERVLRDRNHRNDPELKKWLAEERSQVASAVIGGINP